MTSPTLALSCAVALAAGIASFFVYFHVGEHHMRGVAYVQLFTAICTASGVVLVHSNGSSVADAIANVSFVAGSWLVGVFGSCLVWRAFFNPLNKVPGPWMTRIARIYTMYLFRKLDAYLVIADLHERYGPYVRVGPNDISIADPDAIPLAYGANTTVTKSQWYDTGAPHHSMHTTRDKEVHDRRRRFWAPAFSDKALREYESTLQDFNRKFMQRMDEFHGTPVNVTKWFNLYSFDVMGRLAFGKDYKMLDSGERHWALDLLTEGMEAGGAQPPLWLFRILLDVPGLASGFHRFLKFCADELKWRVQNGAQDGKDITGWLLKAYKDHAHPEQDLYLQGDARLIIVAGSDTTAATLTFLFYHLAMEPSQLQKLRAELQSLAKGEWTDRDIQNAEHLNGAINEALRLHPPVPSGVNRKTAPEGLQVGDVSIPGNVHFIIPPYPIGRDEAVYTDALSFVPERWYSKPEMVKHRDAFIPFSMGPYNCIGKNFARMELRTLTAHLVLNYDVSLAPGEDGRRLLTESHDHFTMSLGRLDLVFTPVRK